MTSIFSVFLGNFEDGEAFSTIFFAVLMAEVSNVIHKEIFFFLVLIFSLVSALQMGKYPALINGFILTLFLPPYKLAPRFMEAV